MSSDHARREFAKKAIDAAVRKVLSSCDPAVAELIWNVQGRSTLLSPVCYVGRGDAAQADRIVGGLLAIAEHREVWLRPLDTWQAAGRTATATFSSLAHHLLACYPVAAVLLSCWFRGVDDAARRAQGWFRHVGQGGSLRTAGFPLVLTKRAAHHFAHAPTDLSIEAALRWAQVRSLKGDDWTARRVTWTRLGHEFEAPEFWDPFLHRLVRESRRIRMPQLWELVEYLHAQRTDQPDFTIRGRSIETLQKEAVAWKSERAREEKRRIVRWEPSAIEPFRHTTADGRDWSIRELLGSDELNAEGKAMRHCVGTYKRQCARRLTTIWSLALETPEGRRRRVTVEVDPETREIDQAKAKFNARPDAASHAVLVEWARREGLKLETC